MKKLVIVINGSGGVGKDTLCECSKQSFKTVSVSSVDPIKSLAKVGGWKGEKDDAGRLLLVRLKQAFVDYNDLPFQYLMGEYAKFLKSDNEILFMHIREPQEIQKIKDAIGNTCKTLLITRNTGVVWHNSVDSGVNAYSYDYTFANDNPIQESAQAFNALLTHILQDLPQ
jgi:hypothetical protein